MDRIVSKIHDCLGCTACASICPVSCIVMTKDKEGFLIPTINEDKCIHCNLCEKSCQMFIKTTSKTIKNMNYVARSKIKKIRKKSASGGAFATLAYSVLNDKGIVYGVGVSESRVQHLRIDNIRNIRELQNSKYVQSDVNNTYIMCKKDLEDGKTVLYSGTPCQIAGLNLFLKKKYDNLITIDIICHGVPSQEFLKNNLENKKKYPFSEITFRYKNPLFNSKSQFILKIKSKNFKKFYLAENDLYFSKFLNGETFRECCYHCSYTNLERISDITIGDCDSINHYDFYNDESNSTIIINTEIGKTIWCKYSNQFDYIPIDIDLEASCNEQLRKPIDRPLNRDTVYLDIKESDFIKKTPLAKKIKILILLTVPTSLIKRVRIITRRG